MFNQNSLCFALLCLCVLLFPVNYELFLGLRFLDVIYVVLLGAVFLTNPRASYVAIFLFWMILIVLLSSVLNGLVRFSALEFERAVFVYKYIFIFTVPFVVLNVIRTDKQVLLICRLLFVVYMMLVAWVYVYAYLFSTGAVIGSSRPSYPFSVDYYLSDAHLFSSYLAIYLVGYMVYFRKIFGHSLYFSLLVLCFSFGATILTGSRTGVMVVVLAMLIAGIYFTVNLVRLRVSFSSRDVISMAVGVLVIGALAGFFHDQIYDYFAGHQELLMRASNFDLSGDASSLGRIAKFWQSVEDFTESGYIIGAGLSSTLIWYDGVFSLLLAHGGLLFLFFVVAFYAHMICRCYVMSMSRRGAFAVFLLVFIVYLISNVVTEYAFVARNSFPVLLLLSILYISATRGSVDGRVNTD